MGTGTIPQQVLTPISGVSATTTSSAIPMLGVRKCSIFYTRAGGTTGNSTLSVTMSGDDTNFVGFNMLIVNTNTSPLQTTTRTGTLTLSTNTTSFVTMDLSAMSLSSMKVVSTRNSSDDGVLTVKVVREFF